MKYGKKGHSGGNMDYGGDYTPQDRSVGGGAYKSRVSTDRGRFQMKGGQGLDNQAMNSDSPHKGFKGNGPSGAAGGYYSQSGKGMDYK